MPEDRTLSELTPKQRRAVAALLSAGDVTAACAAAGISRDTLYRWMKQPAFLEAVRTAEAGALDDLSRSLVTLGHSATETLAAAMAAESAPWATRVRAADAVLGRLLQLRELATLEARVTELERAAGIAGGVR
jgi:phage terminase small subunit